MGRGIFREEFYNVEGDMLDLRLIDTVDGKEAELPFYWWSIILKASGQEVGKISLRLGHNYHSRFNGNIGYEIDDEYRGASLCADSVSDGCGYCPRTRYGQAVPHMRL